MELEFVDRESSPKQSDSVSFDIWDKQKQSHIGYAEGYLTKDYHLIAVINLIESYRNTGLGKTVFSMIIDSLAVRQ